MFDFLGSFAQYSVLSALESTSMIAALMPNYNRADLAFERGEGAYLYDAAGRRYLDFGAGIATSSLGHGHPHLVAAIAEQAAKVIHVSNLYRVPGAERLAQRYVAASFANSVFFCNSGAEANEGLIKSIRKTMADAGNAGEIPDYLFRRRVSRPHAGDLGGDGECEISGRVWAAGRWVRPGAVQRYRGRAGGDYG